jgi:hypothetical protein
MSDQILVGGLIRTRSAGRRHEVPVQFLDDLFPDLRMRADIGETIGSKKRAYTVVELTAVCQCAKGSLENDFGVSKT